MEEAADVVVVGPTKGIVPVLQDHDLVIVGPVEVGDPERGAALAVVAHVRHPVAGPVQDRLVIVIAEGGVGEEGALAGAPVDPDQRRRSNVELHAFKTL